MYSLIISRGLIKNIQLLTRFRPISKYSRCLISTSEKKKDDTLSYAPGLMEKQPKGPETAKDFADVEGQKNWISFGFDMGDMKEDRYLTHLSFFFAVTVMLVTVGYVFMYLPDYKLNHWAKREAFLELERRERLGLPLVDKNYVDPDTVELLSEEELVDIDIHI